MRRALATRTVLTLLAVGLLTGCPAGNYRPPPRPGLGLADAVGRGAAVQLPNAGPIHALAFSPDCRTVAAGCADGTLRQYEVTRRTMSESALNFGGPIFAVAFSPDGRYIALGESSPGGAVVHLLDRSTNRPTFSREVGDYHITSIAFSGGGATLAAGGPARPPRTGDGVVKLWSVPSGEPLPNPPPPHDVTSLALSADGRTLVTAGIPSRAPGAGAADNSLTTSLKSWDVPSGQALSEFARSTIAPRPVAFAADDSVASPGPGGERTVGDVGFWPARGEGATGSGATSTGQGPLSMAFSKDARLLALSGRTDDRVDVWDVFAGRKLHTVYGHDGRATTLALGFHTSRLPQRPVALSPDGKWLAATVGGAAVVIWDLSKLGVVP